MGLNKKLRKLEREVKKMDELRQLDFRSMTTSKWIQKAKICDHQWEYIEFPDIRNDEMIGHNFCRFCHIDEAMVEQISVKGWEEELKQWPSLDSYFGADTEAEMI